MKIRLRTWGRVLVAAVAALVAVSAFVYVYVRVGQMESFTEQAQETIRSEADRENLLRGLARLHEETEGERTELALSIVPVDGIADFIEMVESTALRARLTHEIGSVDVGSLKEGSEQLQVVTLSVRVEGSWERVFRFLRALESAPYAVVISNVVFDGAEVDGIWVGSLSLSALAKK